MMACACCRRAAAWARSTRRPSVGRSRCNIARTFCSEAEANGSIAVAHGGDASCATNGFWSALTIATTQRLPMLFFIEDNGYGISVKSDFQTPGGNIAANLSGFKNLRIIEGDSAKPVEAAAADRKGRGRRARRRRSGAAARAGAASVRALGSGHADVQVSR